MTLEIPPPAHRLHVMPMDHRVATWPIMESMGLNPHRQHRRSGADVVLVVGCLLVIAAVTAWALLG